MSTHSNAEWWPRSGRRFPMTGDNPHDEAGKQGEPEIAEAEWLLRDGPPKKAATPAGSVPTGASPDVGEGFDLADSPFAEPEAEVEAPPIAAVTAKDQASARPREAARPKTARAGESFPIEAEAAVDTVWS